MIDYNKYTSTIIKTVTTKRTTRKDTPRNKIKLTKENKSFLKYIGLLK